MKLQSALLLTLILALLAACSPPLADAPLPTAMAPESTTEPGFNPTFEPSPCPFELPPDVVEGERVQCGFVAVPADHDQPGGDVLRLAVVVIKDLGENRQPDPVILLSGGPGEKTVASALNAAQVLVRFFPNRDFILFDQRGVGLSQPALECPEWEARLFDLLDETDLEVRMRASFEELMACRDRLVAEGHDLSVYNTVQNAADVDAIRQALGYDQINLLGASYGSILAQETARQFPDAIRSVILAATWPLEQSFFVGVSETATDAMLRMVRSCDADAACSEAYPDLEDTLFALVGQLDEEPARMTITNPLDGKPYETALSGGALVDNLTLFLYLTDLIPTLPQAIYDVHNGDYELMAKLRGISLSLYRATSRGMLYSVVCAEDLIGVTPDDLLAARAQLPPALRGNVSEEDIIRYGVFGLCEKWPVEQLDPSFKEPWQSDIPTLLLEGEFDPVTPITYANQVASHLENSYVFEFPGIGHNVLVSNGCSLHIAGQFVDDPGHAPDAACIADMPAMAFDLPREAKSEIVLEPFVHAAFRLQALRPAGWESPSEGVFVRGESSIDQTALIYDRPAMDMADFLQLLVAQLSLIETPESVGQFAANGFEWTLYHVEVQGVAVDVAATPVGDATLILVMQSDVAEQEVLRDAVFFPAVQALTPLESDEK